MLSTAVRSLPLMLDLRLFRGSQTLTVGLLHTRLLVVHVHVGWSPRLAFLPNPRNARMATAIILAILLGGCGGGSSRPAPSPVEIAAETSNPVGGSGSQDVSQIEDSTMAEPEPPQPQPLADPEPPQPQPPANPEPPPLTPEELEYERQGALDIIKAQAMNRRGGTGNGIVVALFDSGSSDHAELSGKYVYESEIDIDCDTVEPGKTCKPQDISPDDTNGHGTFLAGLIAAHKDGVGMRGVAYDAKIASVAIHSGQLTDGQYASWVAGLVPQIDKMVEIGALITNNSWSTPLADYEPGPPEHGGVTAEELGKLIPIDAYQRYVDAGGVQVWAAGNEQARTPSIEGAAPFYFPDLEKGWLVVGSVNLDGTTPSWYSNGCTLVVDFCLVAPGAMGYPPGGDAPHEGITSLDLNEGYRERSGTSLAAPLVAGAIAALKSMYPNLSYQQIRDRILATADKSIFASFPEHMLGGQSIEQLLGQGLLDLDAASIPVGGTAIPTIESAYGPVVPIRGTGASLPAAAVDSYFAGRPILVLDNFQRAPFWVPANAFAEKRGPLLAMSDLRLGKSERDELREAGYVTVDFGDARLQNGDGSEGRVRGAIGLGKRVVEGMASFAGVDGPRDGLYRMADDALGFAVRFASGTVGEMFAGFAANPASDRAGAPTFGSAGWAPRAVAALAFVPQDAQASVGLLAAPALQRPMGWDGAGALALSGDAFEMSYSRRVTCGHACRIGLSGRLVHLDTKAAPLLRFDDASMAAAEVELAVALGERTTLTIGLGMERPLTTAMGKLRLPSAIDENGGIAFDEVPVDGSDFLRLDRGTLRLHYAPADGKSLGVGLTAVRDGFDESQAIAGLQANFAF